MIRLVSLIATIITILPLYGQQGDTLWWVSFRGKELNVKGAEPASLFSARNHLRHARLSIPYDSLDFPVNSRYLDTLRAHASRVLFVSRWLNGAMLVASPTERRSIEEAGILLGPPVYTGTLDLGGTKQSAVLSVEPADTIGATSWIFDLHNARSLPVQGYTGKGIAIGVLDAGFAGVDHNPYFAHLWRNHRVLGQTDLYDRTGNVFDDHSHGTRVLSIMAADSHGVFIGNAPQASYFLVRTETVDAEGPFEEYAWVVGAELADSAGCDLINTSLGYHTFNDSVLNHPYSQLDGQTTIAARGVAIALAKGMAVIVSAGNDGNKPWYHIGTPADATGAITVGAIDTLRSVTSFSSRGPNAAGLIKPDVVAYGNAVPTINEGGTITKASGTSISAPIVCGFAACLLQANPYLRPYQLKTIILHSADNYSSPNNHAGYGIPDFNKALSYTSSDSLTPVYPVRVFPNPFTNNLYITSVRASAYSPFKASLYDIHGQKKAAAIINSSPDIIDAFAFEGLTGLSSGIYLLKLEDENGAQTFKVVKQ